MKRKGNLKTKEYIKQVEKINFGHLLNIEDLVAAMICNENFPPNHPGGFY